MKRESEPDDISEIDELVIAASELDPGPVKIAMLEEAVRQAEMRANDEYAQAVRDEAVEGARRRDVLRHRCEADGEDGQDDGCEEVTAGHADAVLEHDPRCHLGVAGHRRHDYTGLAERGALLRRAVHAHIEHLLDVRIPDRRGANLHRQLLP